MKERVRFQAVAKFFFAVEGALYVSFLCLDLGGGAAAATWLKYAGILLCCLMALASAAFGGDRFTAGALGLTVAADTLLLVLDAHYGAGMLLFLGVQLLYLCRLKRADHGRWLPVQRGVLCVLLLALLWGLGAVQPLHVLAVLYFTMLACNVVQSVQIAVPWGKLFGLGLFLFACCDLCVGAYNSPDLTPPGLYAFVRVGMWLFYLPSQVLIVASGFPGKEEIIYETE